MGGLGYFGIMSEGYFCYDDSIVDSDCDVVWIGGYVDVLVFIIFDNGLVVLVDLDVCFDYYSYGDDLLFNDGFCGYISGVVMLCYLLVVFIDYVMYLIELMVMIGIFGGFGDFIVNEDSICIEFDEFNIFMLNCFVGQDLCLEGI